MYLIVKFGFLDIYQYRYEGFQMINWMGGKRKRAQLNKRGPLAPISNRSNSSRHTEANSNKRI